MWTQPVSPFKTRIKFCSNCLVGQSIESFIKEIEKAVDCCDELASYFKRSYIKGAALNSFESLESFVRSSGRFDPNDKRRWGWHLGVTALFQGSHPNLRRTQNQGRKKHRENLDKIQNNSSNFNKD